MGAENKVRSGTFRVTRFGDKSVSHLKVFEEATSTSFEGHPPHWHEKRKEIIPAVPPLPYIMRMYHASLSDELIHLQNELTVTFEAIVTEAIAPKSRRESISLATAQTPEEFGICMINVEQKLHTGGNRLAVGTTVETKIIPDATVPR